MNFLQFNDNPKIGIFLFLGFFIYLIFRVLHFIISKYYKKKINHLLRKSIYFLELIIWTFFLYEGIMLFKSKNIVFSAFCLLILLFSVGWICWFIVRDYIAGLFLKMDGTFTLNETIEFDNFSGKIAKMGGRGLALEIDSSNSIYIPYNQFFVKRHKKTGSSDNIAKCNFVFKLNSNLKALEALDAIKIFIYQLPWISSKHEQEVFIEGIEDDFTLIKISASLIDKKFQDKFQQKVQERFS